MKTIVYNIGELVTAGGPNALRKGPVMNETEILKNGYLIFEDGKFTETGTDFKMNNRPANALLIDAMGCLVTPGLIDSHTHLIHGGSRAYELPLKLAGVSYMDILNAGGGILSTVRETRSADMNKLCQKAQKTLQTMMMYGVTACEAKSGYGLDSETEKKQLLAVRILNQELPIHIVSTFMGAHAVPSEYQDRKPEYIREIKTMLADFKKEDLASFCDVFCENGVFSLEESQEILEYAKALGYRLKIHADEMIPMGGSRLAAALGCVSADHLMATEDADLELLASHNVVCNLLPLTSFYLDKPFAKARLMIEKGCGVAISTDYNPGSSPSENLQLAMQMAVLKTKMTPRETMAAVTMNAAVSAGISNRKGSITAGKDADFVIFDCLDLNSFFYHFGVNQVRDVYIGGKKVVSDQIYKGVYHEIN
jgi:imidazolonepropionase